MLARCAPRRFFSAVDGVAKHLRDDGVAAKKMNLEPMRLLFRTGLCIDAFDVRFRIGIGSFSHDVRRAEEATVGRLRKQTTRLSLTDANPLSPARAIPKSAIFHGGLRLAGAQSRVVARLGAI